MSATYLILEWHFQTRQWIPIEYNGNVATVIARMVELKTANGDSCNYKLMIIPMCPE